MWTRQGKIGGALECDGTDDYGSVAYTTTFSNMSGITLSAWIKFNSSPSGTTQEVAQKWTGWTFGYSGSGWWFELYSTLGEYIGAYNDAWSPTPNTWYFVTSLYDGSSMKTYINGQLLANHTEALDNRTIANTSGDYLGIGAAGWNGSISGRYFSGLIDDVRIYNYARTAAQIAWDYTKGKPVGWWKFDEGSGITAYDGSGQGNDGTITIGGTGSQTTIGAAWTNGATGKFGKCMSFDGTDDWVSVGNTGIPTGSNPVLTIEAWMKSSGTSGVRGIVGMGVAATNATHISVCEGGSSTFAGSGNRIWISHWGGAYDWNTGVDFNTGAWNHIVYISNGTNDAVYLNGKQVAQQTVSFTVGSNPTVRIGSWDDKGSPFSDQVS